jgi:prepilin-type N-terminal cleavage/methylation domain-containing protein
MNIVPNQNQIHAAHHVAHVASKGFTLLELLVVISIIGTLSSVIMSSVGNARVKAYDAKVKAQLSNIRTAAELYYNTNLNYGIPTIAGTYTTGTGSSTLGNACTTSQLTGMFADPTLAELSKSANYPTGENTIICVSKGTAYAVSDNLSTGNGFWCVDSVGNSVATTSQIATSSTSVVGTTVCR